MTPQRSQSTEPLGESTETHTGIMFLGSAMSILMRLMVQTLRSMKTWIHGRLAIPFDASNAENTRVSDLILQDLRRLLAQALRAVSLSHGAIPIQVRNIHAAMAVQSMEFGTQTGVVSEQENKICLRSFV